MWFHFSYTFKYYKCRLLFFKGRNWIWNGFYFFILKLIHFDASWLLMLFLELNWYKCRKKRQNIWKKRKLNNIHFSCWWWWTSLFFMSRGEYIYFSFRFFGFVDMFNWYLTLTRDSVICVKSMLLCLRYFLFLFSCSLIALQIIAVEYSIFRLLILDNKQNVMEFITRVFYYYRKKGGGNNIKRVLVQ